MTKHKRVAAILLAIMMIFTFMPSMAFAADDAATYTYTIDGSEPGTTTDFVEARNKVSDGGTITVDGTINNDKDLTITGKDYTFDCSGATIASNVQITAAGHCLVANGNVYSYHENHNFNSARATVSTQDPKYAIFTVYCANGHSVKTDAVKYDEVVEETAETITYSATIEYPEGSGKTFTDTWTVEKTAIPDSYDLVENSWDYVKDGENFAVKKDGKVQFYANYTKNGTEVLDANGKAVKLTGEIVGTPTVATQATEEDYGSHDYTVKFAYPDGSYSDEVSIDNVIDTEKLVPEQGALQGVKIATSFNEKGEPVWSETYKQSEHRVGTENYYQAVYATYAEITGITADAVDANGNLTYKYVYADKNGGPDIDGEVKTLAPDTATSTIYECGTAQYRYAEVAETYTDGDAIKTFKFRVNQQWNSSNWGSYVTTPISVTGEHPYSDRSWAESFTPSDIPAYAPAHNHDGRASAKCKYCGKEWSASSSTNYYPIPATTDHDFAKNADGTDKVVTVDATCMNPGFQYKICTLDDGKWVDDEYVLQLNDTETYTFNRTEFGEGHPVLVDGSVTEKGNHKYFVTNVTWPEDAVLAALTPDQDVTCTVEMKCMYNVAHVSTVVYHKNAGTDTDTDKFNAISVDPVVGADCSKADVLTYTVKDVHDVDGNAISKTVTSTAVFGPHTYNNTVTFSEDGKTATVLQQCTRSGCNHVDADGNEAVQTKIATVTAADNADGSTTYTATLDGVTLKDNTKTVFDLSKATVTVNGGETLDINTVTDLKKLVEVKINDAVIDASLYDVAVTAPSNTLVAGVNVVTVSGAKEEVVNTATGTVNCIKPGTLSAGEVKFDGKALPEIPFGEVTYDGNAHKVEVTKVVTTELNKVLEVSDVNVQYSVVAVGNIPEIEKADFTDWAKNLTYSDTAEMTDIDHYLVVAKFEKEGYTTAYVPCAFIAIETIKLVNKEITTNTQVMKYGDKLVATTGDAELDAKIGLSTEKASKAGVGSYYLYQLVTWDPTYEFVDEDGDTVNFYDQVEIEKRNATIVMKDTTVVYNGKAVDLNKLYTVDGVVNDDDLNIIVDTEGGSKEVVEPGTYKLVATANNANYNIAVVNATLKINKIAQTITKVTPAKKSYSANKKGVLGKKKTFKLKAEATGDSKAKVTFKKTKGNAKITINSKGKVTLKKNLKKGTYTVKFTVTKAETAHYAKATVSKSVTVTVK
jgi:hypothetical protein